MVMARPACVCVCVCVCACACERSDGRVRVYCVNIHRRPVQCKAIQSTQPAPPRILAAQHQLVGFCASRIDRTVWVLLGPNDVDALRQHQLYRYGNVCTDCCTRVVVCGLLKPWACHTASGGCRQLFREQRDNSPQPQQVVIARSGIQRLSMGHTKGHAGRRRCECTP